MSKDYKEITYKCDCGHDYGQCNNHNRLELEYSGVTDIYRLIRTYHSDSKTPTINTLYLNSTDINNLRDLLNE